MIENFDFILLTRRNR